MSTATWHAWLPVTLFAQRLFDSFANGSVYAALAVSVSMIFRSTGVLNLAQGQMAMLSAYIAVLLAPGSQQGLAFGNWLEPSVGQLPLWAGIVGAIVISMAIGALIERAIIRPLNDDDPTQAIGATLGVYLLLDALVVRYFGSRTLILGSPFGNDPSDFVSVLGARVHYDTIGITITMVVALGLLGLLQRRTRLGLAFRAVTVSRTSATLSGIRVERVVAVGWALAAGVGALAGTLIAGVVFVRPQMMSRLFVFALAAAALGGLRSPALALAGGYAFALLETMLGGYVGFIDSQVTLAWALGCLILALSFRTSGFARSTKRQRAASTRPAAT